VIHCDLKPDNILVTEEAQVKVSDFGLARATERGHFGTTDGALDGRGTPHYMAPELFLGMAPSAASDIYALGCTLFEILTAIPKVCRDSVEVLTREEVKERHLHDEPKPIEHYCGPLLAPLGVLLRAMIAKGPRERPSAAQVVDELRLQHYRLRQEEHAQEERWPGELEGERPSQAMLRALQAPEAEDVPAVSDRMRAALTEPLPDAYRPADPLPPGFTAGAPSRRRRAIRRPSRSRKWPARSSRMTPSR
jgi:serine/threonine protein kinase